MSVWPLFFHLLTIVVNGFVINSTIDLQPNSLIPFELYQNGTLNYRISDKCNNTLNIYVTRPEWLINQNTVSEYYHEYSQLSVKTAILINRTYRFDSATILVVSTVNVSVVNLFVDNIVSLTGATPHDFFSRLWTPTNILIIIFGTLISITFITMFLVGKYEFTCNNNNRDQEVESLLESDNM
jgi:hypothetical protein